MPSKEFAKILETQLHKSFPLARHMGEWFDIDCNHVIIVADLLAIKIRNMRLQERFDALVDLDIERNYLPIMHGEKFSKMRQEINERDYDKPLHYIEKEIEKLRKAITERTKD